MKGELRRAPGQRGRRWQAERWEWTQSAPNAGQTVPFRGGPGYARGPSDFIDPTVGQPQTKAKESWALRLGLVSCCQIAKMVKNFTL